MQRIWHHPNHCNARRTPYQCMSKTASDSDILYDSERMHASSSSPALPPLMHRPIPTEHPMPMLRPHWQTDTYILVKPTHQTHRSAGRIPQPCHATSNANHTHKQTLVPPMQQKLHCRTSHAWPSDKTHDANCRHQPMTRLDLRTFCNVRP